MDRPEDVRRFPEIFTNTQKALLGVIRGARSRIVLPSPRILKTASASLPRRLPPAGMGLEATTNHLMTDIVPAVSSSSLSPRYFGFVTGGVTPAARLADNVVSALDECIAVKLPHETIASDVESKALEMLSELLSLDKKASGESRADALGMFTSGSSTSNLYGIAFGREYVLQKKKISSVGTSGISETQRIEGGPIRVQVLTAMPHPSIVKAASLTGLGRDAVKQIGYDNEPWRIDLTKLETALRIDNMASIVCIGCGEVNSGKFATDGAKTLQIRQLCNKYDAWLHVDAAFGVFARILPDTLEFEGLRLGTSNIEVADSITGDGHKLLNVPYDCGFFYTRHPPIAKAVFGLPNAQDDYKLPAVYFSTMPPAGSYSPLDIGIQNSRRFRALPVYASLMAYGRDGYQDMVMRQVRMARGIAGFAWDHPDYELLPRPSASAEREATLRSVFILVIMKAKDESLNDQLINRINETGIMYVSGIKWQGDKAIRIAVGNWNVNVDEDLKLVKKVLSDVAAKHKASAVARAKL